MGDITLIQSSSLIQSIYETQNGTIPTSTDMSNLLHVNILNIHFLGFYFFLVKNNQRYKQKYYLSARKKIKDK